MDLNARIGREWRILGKCSRGYLLSEARRRLGAGHGVRPEREALASAILCDWFGRDAVALWSVTRQRPATTPR